MGHLIRLTILVSLGLPLFIHGCKQYSDIKNFASDSIDIYIHLKPNEEWHTGRHFYGNDSVIGNSHKYRLTTDTNRVGVDINLTILELHPRITANLLSFIHGEFLYNGFINEGDTIVPFGIKELSDRGISQSEIVRMALDWEANRFYKELPTILGYGESGYNLTLEIYPVFLNENYVTYKKFTSYYTGGMHGNYSSFLQTYDRKNGTSVDLDEIILPEKIDIVREHIAYHMAAKYPIYSSVNTVDAYLDSLNMWKGNTDKEILFGFMKKNDCNQITLENYPINNPGIHGAGLAFTYEKYHLTPGCDGCPSILLPYDEIRDCLKEPFNRYHSNIKEFNRYQTPNIYTDKAYWYTQTQLDSTRTTWGLADDGNPWPRDISDWYKYKIGHLKKHYSLDDIIGTWVGYGHIHDHRQTLTIRPDGMYINISEEALNEDSVGNMIYNFTETTIGKYVYDSNKNRLELKNWEDMKLNDKNLESYVKILDPQNMHMIIHYIDKDTMYIADEIGDLWPFFREK